MTTMIVLLFGILLMLVSCVSATIKSQSMLILALILSLAAFSGQTIAGTISYVHVCVIAIVLAGLNRWGTRALPLTFLPFCAYVLVASLTAWGEYGSTSSVIALAIAPIAWWAGAQMRVWASQSLSVEMCLAYSLLALVILQLIVSILQLLGLDVFSPNAQTAELTEGRASGTFGHPGNLGKVLVLVTALFLCLSNSLHPHIRIVANGGVIAGFIPLMMSQSRTNIIAVLVLVLTWSLLAPLKRGLAKKLVLPGIACVIGLAFLEPLLRRFQLDPGGGERSRFLRVALEHVPDNLWIGVGPGGYVEYFGQFDRLTGEGWPVHNMFLYLVAEIGVVGLTLLFLPWFCALVEYAAHGANGTNVPPAGRALLSLFVPIVLVGLTGWGLGSGWMFSLWMLTTGFLATRNSSYLAKAEKNAVQAVASERRNAKV